MTMCHSNVVGDLGSVALAVGFYLARRLEDHKAKRSQELFVVGKQVDAICKLMEAVSTQHHHLRTAVAVMRKVLAARPDVLADDELEPTYRYVETYNDFGMRLGEIAPLLTPRALEASSKYLDIFGLVKAVVMEEKGAVLPTDEAIDTAFSTFTYECSVAIRETI
jgi:hypothetical protein